MKTSPVPGFPYAHLVRWPLLALCGLLVLVLVDSTPARSHYDLGMFLRAMIVPGALFISGLQLIAIVRALHCMWRARVMRSALHLYALACGCAYLGLVIWMLWFNPRIWESNCYA